MHRLACRFFLLALLCCPLTASAQLAIQDLWPNQDRLSWSYDGVYWDILSPTESFRGRLIFDGFATLAPGVEVQSLIAQISGLPAKRSLGAPSGLSPLMRSLWYARPELRDAIRTRGGQVAKAVNFWPSLLLGPADAIVGLGHRQTADRVGAWRDEIANWSWWYFPSDLSVGSTFTLQLVPDLANDVFLYGTIRTTSGAVSTAAGSWNDALVVDYVIDQGTGTITDENGNTIGTARFETVGWVAFAPGVGPVACSETGKFVEVDCPNGCPQIPPVGEPVQTVELALSTPPVATETESWGTLKSRWEN